MKKTFFTIALLLAAYFSFGQTIQKGNMLGVHILTVELKPNVTMEQVLDFYNTKWAPAANQSFGFNCFFGKCVRGTECAENKLLMVYQFNSEADRDKYFKPEGGLNELGEKAWAKFAPTNDALQQLASVTETWADWVIK